MTVVTEALWVFVYSVALGAIAYVGFLCWGWWSKRRALAKAWRQYKSQQTWLIQTITTIPPIPTIAPVVPSFHAGGPVHSQLMAGLSVGSTISQVFKSLKDESEPLEETWSNEKVEAWRVVPVTVEQGDDGLWLGFPHPDGLTEDVVTPKQHPVGVELHAECRPSRFPCVDVPSEHCQSEIGYGCGFYAYKTRQQAIKHLETEPTLQAQSWKSARVIAHVLLSGKVIEHESGYRAEILEVINVEPVSYPKASIIPFEEVAAFLPTHSYGFGPTGRSFTASHLSSGGV